VWDAQKDLLMNVAGTFTAIVFWPFIVKQPKQHETQGKIALVTGRERDWRSRPKASPQKAAIIVNDIPEATYTENIVQGILNNGGRAEAAYADLSSVTEIRRLFGLIREKYGRLDILVNNAGITGWSDFFETEEAIFDRVVQLNLKGTLFCTIEAAKIMRETGGGSIINVSSVVTALSVKNLICYVATKGGIEAMTRQMAVELAPTKSGSTASVRDPSIPNAICRKTPTTGKTGEVLSRCNGRANRRKWSARPCSSHPTMLHLLPDRCFTPTEAGVFRAKFQKPA
jgi:hypothetical protein